VQIAGQCLTACKTCTSLTVCNTCINGYYLRNDSRCYSSCLASTYVDNSSWMCKNCPPSCAICQNATYCTVCAVGNYMMTDNMCYSACPKRYYSDNDQLTCKNCPFDCYTCNSDGSCLSCDSLDDHRKPSFDGLRCVAADGYFDNNATVCASCPLICSACTSLTNCTACKPGYFLRIDNYCYTSCLARFFPNTVNNTCDMCPYDCYTCNNIE